MRIGVSRAAATAGPGRRGGNGVGGGVGGGGQGVPGPESTAQRWFDSKLFAGAALDSEGEGDTMPKVSIGGFLEELVAGTSNGALFVEAMRSAGTLSFFPLS